ncbi:vesicular glutamate transporter 3-like [Macrobrachium rosenbergii]|uniref:vesicular glutamate transporter 3-like n=1 Tax=Macrobrachium rosenbergii TaxID=79674 RepID=UPI0034D6E864
MDSSENHHGRVSIISDGEYGAHFQQRLRVVSIPEGSSETTAADIEIIESTIALKNNSEITCSLPDWNATSRDALRVFIFLVTSYLPSAPGLHRSLYRGKSPSGLAQGPTFPCIHNLLATWNPPQDRARFASVLFSGPGTGTIIALSLGGLMNESDFLGGWPSIFYVFGILGILWCIPWLIFMRDSPQKHPRISEEELRYIEANGSTVRTTMRMKVPWRERFTSVPYWTLIVIAWEAVSDSTLSRQKFPLI